MDQSLLSAYGTPTQRVEAALSALQQGKGVLLVDDENRENEGDLIFSAQHLTNTQMAMLIRYCSGIVCLCLSEEKISKLGLPPMVANNQSQYGTAFTVSIEARTGVTTGVSAADRVTTIKAAISEPTDGHAIVQPGHVFPLKAENGGGLSRRGHTEGTIDLMQLAGLQSAGVLCEVTNDDGSMAKLPQLVQFATEHDLPLLSIEDLVLYRQAITAKIA